MGKKVNLTKNALDQGAAAVKAAGEALKQKQNAAHFVKNLGQGLTGTYDHVNPAHYKSSSVETIEKMRRIYGDGLTMIYCEMTAFKYRERLGLKPDQPIEQELGKVRWYEKKAQELRATLSEGDGLNPNWELDHIKELLQLP